MSEWVNGFYAWVQKNGWLLLLIAGFFEILWVFFLKASNGYSRLVPTLLTIPFGLLSAAFLAMAMRPIPMATAYAVWFSIGAVGAAFIGTHFYGETFTLGKFICISLIIAGVVGLKLMSIESGGGGH
jgi:quaternary ammonium compound-resistance protein SugE